MPPKKKQSATRIRDPLTLIVYGPSGNGKTSFTAQFPRCGFICDSQERGISFLSQRNLVPKPVWIDDEFPTVVEKNDRGQLVHGGRAWEKLLTRIWDAAKDKTISSLVVESVTGIETIGFAHHAAQNYQGIMSGKRGFYAYNKGPNEFAKDELPDFVDALDHVWQAGKNVILTAHSRVVSEEAPEGTSVQKHVPYADKNIWPGIHRWASGVFFIGRRVQVDENAKGLRDKARPDVFDRLLYVEGTPYVDAKNWLGLTGVINLGDSPAEGYRNFLKALERTNG